MNRTAALLICVLAPFALLACGLQRPLHRIRSDAILAAEHSKWEKAIADWDEYVNRKPDDDTARYELGRAYMAVGNHGAAQKQFGIAHDMRPLNDKYLDGLAESMFAGGQYDELTAFLNRQTSERGRVVDYSRLGKYAARMGHPDEAQQALLMAARVDRGMNFGPQKDLADFYGSIGDKTNQLRRLRMAWHLAPDEPSLIKALRELGEIPGPSVGLVPDELRQP